MKYACLLCALQAEAASAQNAGLACTPQHGGAHQSNTQPGSAHDGQHTRLSSGIDAHANGQTPEVGGQADGQTDRQPPGAGGQTERQPPGAEGQTDRQLPGAEGQAEREPQGNTLSDQQGSRSERSELEAAWAGWQALRELLLVQRCWWVKLHFE